MVGTLVALDASNATIVNDAGQTHVMAVASVAITPSTTPSAAPPPAAAPNAGTPVASTAGVPTAPSAGASTERYPDDYGRAGA